MKHRRLVSSILSAALILPLIPLHFSASAAGNVTYSRRNPEVAIFNAYTGASGEFYNNNIRKDSPYNAAALFKNGDKTLDFNSQISGETYKYDISGTTLDTLRKPYSNLKTGASGQFVNNHHTHSWKEGLFKKYKANTISCSSLYYYACGSNPTRIVGLWYSKYSRFRAGNNEFSDINFYSDNTEMELRFTNSEYLYDAATKKCTCGGHSVSNVVVAFKDDRAPQLMSIGGNISEGAFKAGDTINIELKYDEPIRFADDKASHDDLYVMLAINGYSANRYPKAMLSKLENDTLYFSYTVPSDEKDTEKTITGIDISPLMGECQLVQVNGSGSFTVSKPSDASSDIGYTKAESYITDLAGNSLENGVYSVNAYIDTKKPEVSEISVTAYARNTDIKEMLGKTDATDPGYPDASDTHMGVNDYMYFSINMTEVLDTGGSASTPYTDLEVETNLRDSAGNVVKLTSSYAPNFTTPRDDVGMGASKGQVTHFILNNLFIEDGMTCVDDDGIIRLTKLIFKDDVYDLAGNKLEQLDIPKEKNTATLYLDANLPEVTTTAQTDDNGKYEVIPEETGFIFPFRISDKSGTNGLEGGFSWKQDGNYTSTFEYAVTTGDEEPQWLEGSMGNYYPFEQVEGEQYLHIRPKQGEGYNITNSSIYFYATDYAGNSYRYQTDKFAKFDIDAVWDSVPPTAVAGDTQRQLTETGGVLSVNVELSDSDLLKEAFYLWNDGETPQMSDITEVPEGNIMDQQTGTVVVRANVNNNESYAKHLWVRVSDRSGNEQMYDLGEFSYNLTSLKYGLSYSKKVSKYLRINIDDIEDGGYLMFMLPAPDAKNQYYVYSGDFAGGGFVNVGTAGWYKVTDTTGDRRNFVPESMTDLDEEYLLYVLQGWRSDTYGYRNGNFDVYVISGRYDAFAFDENGHVTAAGNDMYNVGEEVLTMRLASDYSLEGPDIYEGRSVTTDAYIPEAPEDSGYNYLTDERKLSTLAGMEFTVDFGQDIYGWNNEDIDYSKSYLRVTSYAVGHSFEHHIPLKPQQVQTVVLPDLDYPTGTYWVSLVAESYVGREYYEPFEKSICVIATPACDDFGLEKITYEPDYRDYYYSHGISGEYTYDGECMYLPVAGGRNVLYTSFPEYFVSDGGILVGRDMLIWNVTAGQTVDTASYLVWDQKVLSLVKDKAEAEAEISSQTGRDIPLCLIENTVNTIAVQVMQCNGKDSEIKYYNIYPVNQSVAGSVTATKHENGGVVVDSGDVIFTPDEGQSMDGVRVYSVYEDENGEKHKQELLPQADGTFRHPLSPGQNVYYIHTVDKYGNVTLIGRDKEASIIRPLYDVILDDKAPVVTELEKTSSGSLYTVKFRVTDNMFYNTMMDMPVKLRFYFDEEYSKRIGSKSEEGFEITLENFNERYIMSKFNGMDFEWETETSNNAGIYKITATRTANNGEQYVDVTVYGVTKYVESEEDGSAVDFKLNVDATDIFGFTGTGSMDISSSNVRPHVLTDDGNKPEYVNLSGGFDYALQLKFDTPVQPEKSWIIADPTGYSDTWTDGFPITSDGTWEVEFYDIFGELMTDEITLTDTFKVFKSVDEHMKAVDMGIDLSITPTELTGESVTLTASVNEGNEDGVMLLKKLNGGTIGSPAETKNVPMREKLGIVEENGMYVIYLYDREYTFDELFRQGYYVRGDRLNIYIDNIGKEAPEADPRFYLEQFGQEYTVDDLTAAFPNGVETTGRVEVWYETSRNVTAVNGTADRKMFKYGDDTSYKFEYEDDLGNAGSWEFDLSDYGITLITPPEPPKDEKSPDVSVDIYAKTFGNYKSAESFTAGEEQALVTERFENIGYVQDYSIKVKAYDDSSYKVLLLSSPPSSLSYTSSSDTISGVKLSGNTVTVTKDTASDFTVAVVDNAAAETGAGSDNFTYFTIRKEDIEKWFDNTKPTVEKTTVSNGLYEQIVYLKFSDTTDSGEELDAETVTLSSPILDKETDGQYAGQYKKVFNDNVSENVVFYDLVGNMGDTTSIGVTGIDTEPPKLDISWTPPYMTPEGETDITSYTLGPVNMSVYAHIKANKSIDVENVALTAYTINGTDWIDVPSGDINDVPGNYVSYTVSSEQINVCFAEGGIGIRLEVPAPNGKTSKAEVYLPQNIIDKLIPQIKVETNRLMRDGATVPYGVQVTLTPDESVYCSNYGGAGTEYTKDAPLKITIMDNGKQEILFADRAGNRTAATIDITDIDNRAPVLSVEPDLTQTPVTGTDQTVTVTADEDCTLQFDGTSYSVKAGEGKELSFAKNGVYTVTATDAAGNLSMLNIPVGNIDKTPPNISFDKSTIRVRQDSDMTELKAALDSGVTVWDPYNDTVPTWSYETDQNGNPLVELSAIGIYSVVYTVTDAVGNSAQLTRYVSVNDKNQPGITIDGEAAEAEGTMVIASGDHVIKVENITEIAPGVLEPYTLKITRGMSTIGQVKYRQSDIEVAEDGTFSITPGFYTVSVITQSRKTFRAILYVEK